MLKISGNPTQRQIELQQVATDLESGKLIMNAMLLFSLLAKYEPALLATGKYSNSTAIINGQKGLTIALFYLLYANLLSTHKAQINFDTVMTTLQSQNGQDFANTLKLLTKSNLLPQDAPDRAQANFDAIITILKTQHGGRFVQIFYLITSSTNLLSANTPDRTQANFESIIAILNGQDATYLYPTLCFLKQSELLSTSHAQANFDAVITILKAQNGHSLYIALDFLKNTARILTINNAQANFDAITTIFKTQYGNHLIKIFGLITPSTNLLSANTPDRTQANFESITTILNGQNAAHLYVVLYFLKQSTLLSASNAQSNFDAVIHLLNRPDGQYLASILTGLIQAGLLPTSTPAEAQTNFQAVIECSNLAFLHEELTTHDKSAAQYQSVLSSMKRFGLLSSTISSADRTPASQAAAPTPVPSSTHSA